MKNVLLIVFVFSIAFVQAQSDKSLVRQGNKHYQSNQYSDAEINYRKALDKNPKSLSGNFNLADAVYQQKDYEQSAKLFAKIGQADLSKDQKSKAYYNLGNSLVQAKKYEPGIEAYKMALRNNPADEQARYNLDYARKMLKQKQDQNKDKKKQDNKQKQNDKKKQDQKKKDDQKKQDQKDKQKDKQDQKQNQEKPQDNKKDQGQKQQQMNDQKSKQISKKDAERMLAALKNNEKKTMEKLKKGKKGKVKVVKKEKDW